MIADEKPLTSAIGSPDASLLAKGAFHFAIVNLIEQELSVWRSLPDRPPFIDEPHLNQNLCLHLNHAARHGGLDSIEFIQEPLQAGSRRGDIGVMTPGTIIVEGRSYSGWVQLFPIECKRIPTPSDSRRSDCEYVHGLPGHRNGAIERFKHRLHGHLNQGAMIIGYVQSESCLYWQDTINTRLNTLANESQSGNLWFPVELLSMTTNTNADIHRFHSRHRRVPDEHGLSDEIEIIHLWSLMP